MTLLLLTLVASWAQAFQSDCKLINVEFEPKGCQARECYNVRANVESTCQILEGIWSPAGAEIGWPPSDWNKDRVSPAIYELVADTEIRPGLVVRSKGPKVDRAQFPALMYFGGKLEYIGALAQPADLGCGVVAAQDSTLTWNGYGNGTPYYVQLATRLVVGEEQFSPGDEIGFNVTWNTDDNGTAERPKVYRWYRGQKGYAFPCTSWKYPGL